MSRIVAWTGQRGVDTWVAQAAIKLGMPFTLVLPLEVAHFAQSCCR